MKNKAKQANNSAFHEVLKSTPLKTKIKVINKVAFITLLTKLGLRENKVWEDAENEMLDKLTKFSDRHTKRILKEIKKHKEHKKFKKSKKRKNGKRNGKI